MDPLLQQELAAAGLRLQKAISRVVNEAPECVTRKNNKWSFEFKNQMSGESITVTYAGPKIADSPSLPN
jgi:hypothetical protein